MPRSLLAGLVVVLAAITMAAPLAYHADDVLAHTHARAGLVYLN